MFNFNTLSNDDTTVKADFVNTRYEFEKLMSKNQLYLKATFILIILFVKQGCSGYKKLDKESLIYRYLI